MNPAELALSASGETALCAVRLPDGRIVETPSGGSTRGTDLIPAIAELLASHGLTPRDLGRLRVDVGPGSYTGLRVAVTFARTTASFTGARLAQFTSLELLAHAAWARGGIGHDRDLLVVLDARRQRFHVARARLVDGVVTLVSAPAAVDLPHLAGTLDVARDDRPIFVAEPRLHETLAPHARELRPLTQTVASDLLAPSLATRDIAIDAIEPLYLMATYAD